MMCKEIRVPGAALREAILSLDVQAFWRENARCVERFSTNKPRVPVVFHLGEDWIKSVMNVYPHDRFYLDHDYQQTVRLACDRIAQERLGRRIGPGIDLGSPMYASLFGGRVVFPETAPPWIEPVIHDPRRDIPPLIDRMDKVDLLEQGLMPTWLERRERILQEYGVTINRGTGCHGSATMGAMLCGTTRFALFLYDYPDLMHTLMDCIARTMIRFMEICRKTFGLSMRGCAIYNDDAALLSPKMYAEFGFPVEKAIYDRFCPDPEDDRYLHADSAMTHLLPALNELCIHRVNLGPTVDPLDIRREMPNTVVCGQVPPFVVRNGTPEEVVAAARKDIEAVGADGGLVLTTAGSVNEGTPIINLLALMYATHQYGRYPMVRY